MRHRNLSVSFRYVGPEAYHPAEAHAFKIDANFSSPLIACLTQAVKGPGNNNSILSTGRQEITSTVIRKGQSFEMWSLSECIPWMTVDLAECVAIVTLNLCTIIVFMRNRKRSMYLVINLAVIDMFVGGITVSILFYKTGVFCNLWEWYLTDYGTSTFIGTLFRLFPIGSITNITSIALERVHATFCPFRHRVLKKWAYGLIVGVVWVTSGMASVTYTLLVHFEEIQLLVYTGFTFLSICLLIICISYTSIVIKVRCGAQPQHHGAASRERKLTMTLLIVTIVSLLLYLPFVFLFVFSISKSGILLIHLRTAVLFLYFANSLVNPILYAIRMPEYRSAFLALFRRRPQQQREVVELPLRDM